MQAHAHTTGSSSRDQRAHEDRVAYLAAMFAIGEISEPELQELYEALRAGGEAGKQAARVAWETLTVTTDLRATLNTMLQDAVSHHLDTEAPEGSNVAADTFLASVMQRLGFVRPRLREVATPPPRAGRGIRWLFLLAGVLLGVLITFQVVRRHAAPQMVAQIVAVQGDVTSDGRALPPQTEVMPQPIIVSRDATMTLRWPDGSRARVAGPANVVPQNGSLSLSVGRLWLTAADEFNVGLPDGQLQVEDDTRLAVMAVHGRSLVGVESGQALFVHPQQQTHTTIMADRMLGPDGATHAWVRDDRWERRGRQRLLQYEGAPDAWHFSATVTPAGLDDALMIRGRDELQGTVRIAPGSVLIRRRGTTPQRLELTGAPLLERRLELDGLGSQQPVLRIRGLDHAIPLPFDGPPGSVELIGGVRLSNIDFHTGPAPGPTR